MEVKLINYTKDPEKTIAAAAKICYSPLSGEALFDDLDQGKAGKFIKKLVALGHMSPIEHASFTFSIEGVSRALTHQLVRHRLASYSQKSQRYVQEAGFEYVIPPSIARNEEALLLYEEKMLILQETYQKLLEIVPPEDARYVLPNAVESNLVATFNARSLLHFFELRCCQRAQWEIRNLAEAMLAEVKKVAPCLFAGAGPTCVSEGVCYEGKMSCGRVKVIKTRG